MGGICSKNKNLDKDSHNIKDSDSLIEEKKPKEKTIEEKHKI